MIAPTRRHISPRSRGKALGIVLSSLVLVSGCGGESISDEPTIESVSTSSSPTRTTTSKTTTTEPTPQTGRVEGGTPSAISPAAVGPTLVECIYGGGAWTENGWMSDGSYGYHPQCAALRNEQLAQYPYVCPQTDHHVADLSECLYPTGIPALPAEAQYPSIGDAPTETEEPIASPVEPGVDAERGAEVCESRDTSGACR